MSISGLSRVRVGSGSVPGMLRTLRYVLNLFLVFSGSVSGLFESLPVQCFY